MVLNKAIDTALAVNGFTMPARHGFANHKRRIRRMQKRLIHQGLSNNLKHNLIVQHVAYHTLQYGEWVKTLSTREYRPVDKTKLFKRKPVKKQHEQEPT